MDRPIVALATSSGYPDLDEDGPALRAALADVGIDAEVAVWDDPAVDWDRYSGVLIRSTWDYTQRVADFLAWARRVGTINPPQLVAWNADKHYLQDRAAASVPVVPTRYVAPGEALPQVDWPDVVVKPTVSASAAGTSRFAGGR